MRLLGQLVRRVAGEELRLDTYLARQLPHLRGREGQAVRAFATAFLCDHAESCTLLRSYRLLRERLDQSENEKNRRIPVPPVRHRSLRRLAAQVWPLLAKDSVDDRQKKKRFLQAVIRHRGSVRKALQRLAEFQTQEPDTDPVQWCLAKLTQAAAQPSSWTEQMVAVRTVQTLGILDLQGYERLIAQLGGFQDREVRQPRASASAML
jgi:hypothetical protein